MNEFTIFIAYNLQTRLLQRCSKCKEKEGMMSDEMRKKIVGGLKFLIY